MKKLKRRYKYLKTNLFILSAVFFISGCAGTKVRCPTDFPQLQKVLLPSFIPETTVHERINATLHKGFLVLGAEGDVYFVPPDTMRLELRSEWGTALVNLRKAGNFITINNEQKKIESGLPSGIYEWIIGTAGLKVLVGRPGILDLAPPESIHVFCDKERMQLISPGFTFVLSNDFTTLNRIESITEGYSCEIMEYEKYQNEYLPKRIRISLKNGDMVEFDIMERTWNKPFNGNFILK